MCAKASVFFITPTVTIMASSLDTLETEACLIANSESGFCTCGARGNWLKIRLACEMWSINVTRL